MRPSGLRSIGLLDLMRSTTGGALRRRTPTMAAIVLLLCMSLGYQGSALARPAYDPGSAVADTSADGAIGDASTEAFLGGTLPYFDGFEAADNFAGWIQYPGGVPARVQASDIDRLNVGDGKSILPPDDQLPGPTANEYMALLCNGPDDRNSTDSNENIDGDPDNNSDNDRTSLTQTFTLLPHQVPATLSFDWNFLTAESDGDIVPDPFDDFFRVTLDGQPILSGSAPGGGPSPYPDVPVDGVRVEISGCHFEWGQSEWSKFQYLITAPGDYELEFLVADQGTNDFWIDSGVLLDNIRVEAEVDLTIAKDARPDPAIAGEPLFYDITVENLGSGRANGVVVTDTLPSGVSYVTADAPPVDDGMGGLVDPACSETAPGSNVVECALGSLGGGESTSFTIQVEVDPSAAATGAETLTNEAVVDSFNIDSNELNNTVRQVTFLDDLADLRIMKVSKPDDTVRAGEYFTYTVLVENLGPSTARTVAFTDTMLSSGAFQLVQLLEDPTRNDSCSVDLQAPNNQLITCSLADPLEPVGSGLGSGRWTVQVLVTAAQTQDVNNEVRVFTRDDPATGTPGTPDPDTSNNVARDAISILDTSNLSLTKTAEGRLHSPQDCGTVTDAADQVTAGDEIVYTLTVTNQVVGQGEPGGSTATNVVVEDYVPAGVEVVSITGTGPAGAAGCSPGTPGFTTDPASCNVGTLATGQSATVTIVLLVDPDYVGSSDSNLLQNGAFAYSDNIDPDLNDNLASQTTAVTEVADVAVTKMGSGSPVVAGTPLSYEIVVSNSGPSTAREVIVRDQLPPEVRFVGARIENLSGRDTCTYSEGAHEVVCSLFDIQPTAAGVGQRLVFINTHVLEQTEVASVFNTVTAASDQTPDCNPTNNLATVETEVNIFADLMIDKWSVPEKVNAGEQKRYFVKVTNKGPSDARNVVVYDLLPDEVEYEIDTSAPMCTQPPELVGYRAPLAGPTSATGLATLFVNTATDQIHWAVELSDIAGVTQIDLVDGGGATLRNLYTGPAPLVSPTSPASGRFTDAATAAAIASGNAAINVSTVAYPSPGSEITGTIVLALNPPLRCELGQMAPVPGRGGRDGDSGPGTGVKTFEIWARVLPETYSGTTITNVAIVDNVETELEIEATGISYDGSPWISPPPANLGPYTMTPFPADGRPLNQNVSDVPSPLGGAVGFSISLEHKTAPIDGWIPWSHGYSGDVYVSNGPRTVTLTMPPDTGAFYLYEQSDFPGLYTFTATADDGTTSGGMATFSPHGARYVGFYANPGAALTSVTVTMTGGPPWANMAVGEFGIAPAVRQLGPTASDNVASSRNLVLTKSDLKVTKFGKRDERVRAGDILTYTVIIDNLGPSYAQDVALKDILQSSGVFDLIDIATDRDAYCVGIPGPDPGVDIAGTPWPPQTAPPPFGVLLPTGVPDIRERLEVDCTLTEGDDPATPENESQLATLAADGPPNAGRWILTLRVRARQEQDINNIADVLSLASDPDPGNNHAEVAHEISAVADLSIAKEAVGEIQVDGQPGLVFDITTPSQPFPFAPNYTTSPDQVTAGRRIAYRLFIENLGPSDAENVLVLDRMPPGVTLYPGSLTVSQGSCETGTPGDVTDRLRCGLGTIVSFGTAEIAFEVLVDPAVSPGNVLENDAFVTSDVFDDDNSNNHVHAQTSVNTWADMSIVKSSVGEVATSCNDVSSELVFEDLAGQVTAGRTLRYEVTVQNNGASDAQGVLVRETLPPTGEVAFLRADGATCRPDDVQANTVWCSLGTVAAGARVTFDVYVFVNPTLADGTLLTNSATVMESGATPPGQPAELVPGQPQVPHALPMTDDPYLANNFTSAETTVTAVADLEVEKWSTPVKVFAGEQKTYTIKITNKGSSTALDVVLVDELPSDVWYEIDTLGPQCNLTQQGPDVLTCSLGNMAPGEMIQFDIWVRVDPATVIDPLTPGTTIVNTATVSSPTTDHCLDNNVAVSENLVLQKADLHITKFGKMDFQVRAGDVLTYTVIIDNYGPSYANRVALKDVLQSSEIYDVIDINSDRDAYCVGLPGPQPGLDLPATAWPLVIPAPPAFQVLPPTGMKDVNQRLELDCTLTDGDDLGTPQNEGRLAVLQADGPQNAGRWILTVRVRAPQTQDINNIADTLSDAYDPIRGNNHAEVMHEITDVADLEIVKEFVGEVQVVGQEGRVFDITNPGPFPYAPYYTTSDTQVTSGRRIRYTMTITNHGPSDAENTVITDRLPPGVTLVPGTLTTSQGNCETGTPGEPLDRLTCGLGWIYWMETETITFDVLVDPAVAAGTVLENDAFVTSDIFDDNNRNNYTNTQTIANTFADMSIAKSAVGQNRILWDEALRRWVVADIPNEVTAGHELRYEITVQNNGASDAQNVQVMDLLPDYFPGSPHLATTFLRSEGAWCRPDDELATELFAGPPPAEGQAIFCNLGLIPAGARRTFDIYVLVDPSVPDQTILDNGAMVLYGPASPPTQPPALFPGVPNLPPTLPTTDDPYPDNNYAVQETVVNAAADIWITKKDVPAEARFDKRFEPDEAMAGLEHRYLITFGNDGWSAAREVGITDFLDYKQLDPDILGETFVRCEPVDPDDLVTCEFEAPNIVRVSEFLTQNDVVIPAVDAGELSPGEVFSFYLITKVDAGYVLDADDMLAENTVEITTYTTDLHEQNNTDTEQTLIVAEADLTLSKADDAEGFLICDPVVPGGMITYDLLVENLGPSDAADVYVVDQLPEGVVLDPAHVDVEVVGERGAVIEIRDDGRIEVRVGNDPNNEGDDELGRINVGTEPVHIRITVMVREDAECGSDLVNVAYVETRQNDEDWPPAPEPFPGIDGGPRTPTVDPDTTNNGVVEATKVECPSIEVNKTVSFDGTCPGRDVTLINEVAQPVTFCYEITNTGTTYLDSIHITDTLTARTIEPTIIFTDTITFGGDPKVPVAPGETVLRQVTIPHLLTNWDCGIVTDTVVVTANPVNSGRTDLPCLPIVTASDTAEIEVPCAGVDFRLQLPTINTSECDTWIQVQNVGDEPTMPLLIVWGESGFCPPQAAGPLKAECGGLLRPGSAWSFAEGQVPAGAMSGVMYSLNVTEIEVQPGAFVPFGALVCDEIFYQVVGDYLDWVRFDSAYQNRGQFRGFDFGKYRGEPIAVSVNRQCPDPVDPNLRVNAAYTAISSDMEGAADPFYGGYMYYAPLLFADMQALNSVLYIQNSGVLCSSIEIWFKAQDNCLRSILGDVLALAPGETVRFDPNTVVGPGWVGSAWIRATQPMGVIVDTFGSNHFTSYSALPADIYDLDFSYGNQVNFAPLVYSEYQGWDTAIQVQNVSATTNAKVKVYFLDRAGGVITTLVDWVCPRGSQTFFLPLVAGLPGNWVGSVRVESQEWLTPGGPRVDPPRIASVVLLEKWADPQRTVRREAVAYNAQGECLLYDWQIGGSTGGTKSGSAVFAVPLVAKEYRGITTELAITNLVPKPGFTDFAIYLYDQNGLVDYVCQKLGEKQVEYIDLATWGAVPKHFMGSAVVSAVFWEHDIFDGKGQFQRNVVGLGGVAVERIGGTLGQPDVPGDESKAFEAFPIYNHFHLERPLDCPGIPGRH